MGVQQDVISFLAEFTGINETKIRLETLVNDELGVDGDDGLELLETFSKKFGVDLGPLCKSYFGGEGLPLLSIITWPVRVLLGKASENNVQSPLRVKTLVESAENKVWTDI